MRRIILVLSLFILLAPFSFGTGEQTSLNAGSLRILEILGTSPPRESLYREFHVLEDLGEILVAQPAEPDRVLLKKLQIPSRLVSIPSGAGDLYIVSLKGLSLEGLSKVSVVLYEHEDLALVGAGKEAYSQLKRPVLHYGLMNGIRPLNLDRISPPKKLNLPPAGKLGSRSPDPRIVDMVAQVDKDNLQATVQDLQDMGERKAGSGAFVAETYLVDAFNAIGGLTVTTHHFSSSYSDNVIAELPGAVDPSVTYIVGAHYDSISYSGPAPGADDNASGTASVVEIARILSQHPFKYTLRFVCFNAEELGLIGSEAYCDLLVSQGENVAAYINLDMNAYRNPNDPYDVDFVTNYSSSSLISYCSEMFAAYVPSLGITQGPLSGGTSDHQSFTQHGYTACFPFEDLDHYSPYIHTPDDVIGTSANDFILSEMITKGVLASLATLASPLDLQILHTPLSDTTDASGPYPVEADVFSLIGLDVSRATLYYDLGSGFISKNMAPTGIGSGFISSIPGLPLGYVKYYFEAEDSMGNTERLPEGFGVQHFQFFVGYLDDIFADDFEVSDNGWTHGGTGQDDWMRGVPTGSGGYDPDYAFSGEKVWGNDLGPSGWNGNYQPNVDNWLESPSIDCTGYTNIFLRYRRWLTVEEGMYDQARILVNGNEIFLNPYSGDLIDTEWLFHEIDISDFADNSPSVSLRFTLTTDAGKELGGWNIDDLHVGTTSAGDASSLIPSEIYVSLSSGGVIHFTIDCADDQAGRTYLLLLSGSGTSPGTPVGSITIPLNVDNYTRYCFANRNNAVFQDFQGVLDAQGNATAAFNVPRAPIPSLIGKTLSFAWVTLAPLDFASNPASVRFVE